MATSYKTPGVYVEEIVKFPPSVAEVETAIPAFIGYTSFARKDVAGDLLLLPYRITSLLEYEQYFGEGPEYTTFTLAVDDNFIPVEKDTTVGDSKFYLYDAVRAFYDNGGGPCYIVSVGDYSGDIEDTDLGDGIDALSKFDEPTLIAFPDAVTLDADKLGSLQQKGLKQCGELGDRFCVFDLKRMANSNGTENLSSSIDSFRTNVGMNYIKYGAAYHPYIKTTYDKTFRFKDINNNIEQSGIPKKFKDFFKDTDLDSDGVKIKDKITNYESLVGITGTPGDNENLETGLETFYATIGGATDSATAYNSLAAAYASDKDNMTKLKAVFNYLFHYALQVDGMIIDNNDALVKTDVIKHPDFLASTMNFVKINVKPILQDLIDLDNDAFSTTKLKDPAPGSLTFAGVSAKFKSVNGGNILKGMAVSPGIEPIAAGGTEASRRDAAVFVLNTIHNELKAAVATIVSLGEGYETSLEKTMINLVPGYKSILKVLNSKVTTMPPSGAVLGVIAMVDRDRGVWKAPANVSLSSVSGVDTFIDDKTQEGMNIDANAGKSINAVRPFYGKGVLVWGSRTLAGNDNEWRYVPVRRFFNFVEESCKKSTSWAVFEPNDANTWLRIKAQIENFLNNLWRRGALAGAKPEHAYIVNCGLGITMTAQDILNGYLNVEIALAAVRPAEFVVLKFSHKLQQS
jgi:phage tail sheath protein FI